MGRVAPHITVERANGPTQRLTGSTGGDFLSLLPQIGAQNTLFAPHFGRPRFNGVLPWDVEPVIGLKIAPKWYAYRQCGLLSDKLLALEGSNA
jgi:hypothetical protein